MVPNLVLLNISNSYEQFYKPEKIFVFTVSKYDFYDAYSNLASYTAITDRVIRRNKFGFR